MSICHNLYLIHSFVESLLNCVLVTEGKLSVLYGETVIHCIVHINLYVSWHCSTYIKQLKPEDDMVSELNLNIPESWHALFLILIPRHLWSEINYADCKSTLLPVVPILMSLLYAQFPTLFLSNTNYSQKKDLFISKTGEVYDMIETTLLVSQNIIFTMHVWGQSVGMVYANMQYAWSVMIKTNPSVTEVLRTRLCTIQILKNMRGAVTDYMI